MKKRTFAMLLCLAMVFALLPSAVLADEATGNGGTDAPLTIAVTTPFGYRKYGDSRSCWFTITNNTDAAIVLKRAVISVSPRNDLINLPIGYNPGDNGDELAARGTATIKVLASAYLDVGDYTVELSWGSNAYPVSATDTLHVRKDNTFTASPDSLLFAEQYEGYATAPAAETVTVKNTSFEEENFNISIDNTEFEVSPASLTLDPDAEGTFTVRPKTGLAAGTHTAAITISNGVTAEDEQVSASFTVHAPNTFTASPDSLLFAEQYEGYLSAPVAETVTVKNTGTKAETYGIANSNVTAFEVSPASLTLDPDAEGTFTVRPKTGLAAGTHTAAITISNGNTAKDKQINASFTALPPIEYEITQGQNGKAAKDSTDGLDFTANGELDAFTDVFVDGEKLSDQHYTTRSGSTIVTLKASYLKTLSVGRHTLRINYTDGYAETTFTILAEIAEAPVPETGDDAQPVLWLGIALMASAGLAISVVRRRRLNG